MKKPIFNINIYKPERKKEIKESGFTFYNNIFFSLLISLTIIILVCTFILFVFYLPQRRLIENAYTEADMLEHNLQGLKDISSRLDEKRGLYLNLRSEAVSWHDKLTVLSDILPERTWFSKIEFPGRAGQIEGGEQLVFSGLTFSGIMGENLDQIGDLLMSLNESSEFKKEFSPLYLTFTKKSDTELGITLFQFTGQTKDLKNLNNAQ